MPDPDRTTRRIVITGDRPLALALAAGFASSRVALVAPEGGRADDDPPRIPCDFASESAVDAAFRAADAHLGGIDQIVHTWLPPSLLQRADFAALSESSWIEGCERALAAAWWVARRAQDRLLPTKGALVFVVPTIGMSGAAGYAMLAAVAEGLRVLAKGCGRQWGTAGVTANTVAAAPHLWLGDQIGEELTRAVSLSKHALGGPGDPAADLAPLIGLLGERDAHFLTAGTLVADGGIWMGL